jgi:hypothetical protein
MSRGLLDEPTLKFIADKLPDLKQMEVTVGTLSPDIVSIKFPHTSTVPIASVCLNDAINTLTEARYALHEVYAHRIYYLEKTEKPNEMAAIYFARFYADDIALRLYTAAEHLASAIIAMLELNLQEIANIKKANPSRISLASAVGTFLLEQKPDHPISIAISDLIKTDEWEKTHDYRNKWVHEQPPLIKGLGIVWKRQILWHDDEEEVRPGVKTRTLYIGGGVKPELTVDDLVDFTERALNKFVKTTECILNFYVELLDKKGMKLEGNKVKFNPFG